MKHRNRDCYPGVIIFLMVVLGLMALGGVIWLGLC